MENIELDGLCDWIANTLTEYTDEVIEAEKRTVDRVADEANDTIKQHITFKRNKGDKYVKAFALKVTKNTALTKEKTWYVKAPHFRLTHLLEYGHLLKNGGRSRAFPHIKYGDELAEKRMSEVLKEELQK